MMRSLFAAVSGLKNHQVRMDVIGNNISNVNTIGYKRSRTTFQEEFAQTIAGATRPNEGMGGTNAMQVGIGMRMGSVDTLFSQGAMESSGRPLDLAIQGDAFFVVKQGAMQQYTRAGNFQLDADGRVVTATGARVQGHMATAGKLSQSLGDITLPINQQTPAQATTGAVLGGNLDASAAVGKQVATSIRVFDSQGGDHDLKVVLEKTATNQWSWTIDPSTLSAGMTVSPATGAVTFDAQGQLTSPTTDPTITISPPAVGDFNPIVISLGLGAGSASGLTQYAGSSSAVLRDQDGYTSGTLQSFDIDKTGTIIGAFSNGTTQVLGQLAVAEFSNPGGLVKAGDSLWSESANSGGAVVEFLDGTGGTSIYSGMLEMSNVDMTAELTDMIITQRGFQANGKVITTSDEMLQEIVNLKR